MAGRLGCMKGVGQGSCPHPGNALDQHHLQIASSFQCLMSLALPCVLPDIAFLPDLTFLKKAVLKQAVCSSVKLSILLIWQRGSQLPLYVSLVNNLVTQAPACGPWLWRSSDVYAISCPGADTQQLLKSCMSWWHCKVLRPLSCL